MSKTFNDTGMGRIIAWISARVFKKSEAVTTQTLGIDSTPSNNSSNLVTSGGVYSALSGKQDVLTLDTIPTENSTNPVTSGGIYNIITENEEVTAAALNDLNDRIVDLEDVDTSPLQNSTSLVTSGGVYSAVSAKYTKPSTGIPASDLESGVIPTISTNISTDASSDVKTASPKAVKDYVDGKVIEYGANLQSTPTAPLCHMSLLNSDLPGGDLDDFSNVQPDLYLNLQRREVVSAEALYSGIFALKREELDPTDPMNGTTSTKKLIIIHVLWSSGTWSWGYYEVAPISNNVITDKTSYVKAASPFAVYNAVHPEIVSSQPAGGFAPNVLYNLGTLSSNTTFSLATPSDANIVNHYYWTFETGSTAPTITWPSGLTWYGGSAPTISASKHYEISIVNNIAISMEV